MLSCRSALLPLFVGAFLLITSTAAQAASWTPLQPASMKRSEGSLVVHDGGVFHFNGFNASIDLVNSVERYDIAADRWETVATTSTSDDLPSGVTHTGVVVVDGEIWLIGGRIGDHPGRVSDRVVVFDLETYQWRDGPRLPLPFAGGGAARVGDRIHVFGGLDPLARCDVGTHLVYDLANPDGGWQDLTGSSPMPLPRNHFGTTVMAGRIYAIGGQHGHHDCAALKNQRLETRLAHAYDPATDRWIRLQDLPTPLSHNEPSTFAHAGLLWTVGGVASQRVFTYDADLDRWTLRQDLALPQPMFAPGARILDGNRLYLFGGGTPNVYFPQVRTWVTDVPGLDPSDDSQDPAPMSDGADTDADDSPAAGTVAHRINVGGPALVDAATGSVWRADTASDALHGAGTSVRWSTNATASVATGNGAPAALFQTKRTSFDTSTGLAWSLPVTPGDYEVRLHMAEMWPGAFQAGVRRFGVEIEGERVDVGIDPFARHGARQGHVLSYRVSSDASLELVLRHERQHPMVQGLEIVAIDARDEAPSGDTDGDDAGDPGNGPRDEATADADGAAGNGLDPAPTNTVDDAPEDTAADGANADVDAPTGVAGRAAYRINVGGPALQDATGTWSADTGPNALHGAGPSWRWSTGAVPTVSIANGPPAALFQTKRTSFDTSAGLAWSFPVTPGRHEVRLYLAEIWPGAFDSGTRRFDVEIEGDRAESSIDLFDRFGARDGRVLRYTVDSDATLDLVLRHDRQNPVLQGIEIIALASPDNPSSGADDATGTTGTIGGDPDSTVGSAGDDDPVPTDGGSGNAPIALATLTIDELDTVFGDVPVGTAEERRIEIANTGGRPLTITDVSLVGGSNAFALALEAGARLAPGEARVVSLSFAPEAPGPAESVFAINHDGETGLALLTMAGTASAMPDGSTLGTLRSVWRLNVGGETVLGNDGVPWLGDQEGASRGIEHDGSSAYATAIAVARDATVPENAPATLFRTERWTSDREAGLAWRFPVAPGQHEVRLLFAEIYPGNFKDAARRFDVTLDGRMVLASLDVHAEAGPRVGMARRFVIDSDGSIDLSLTAVTGHPALKAIEILECVDACSAP